jgi:hypothetical protein
VCLYCYLVRCDFDCSADVQWCLKVLSMFGCKGRINSGCESGLSDELVLIDRFLRGEIIRI